MLLQTRHVRAWWDVARRSRSGLALQTSTGEVSAALPLPSSYRQVMIERGGCIACSQRSTLTTPSLRLGRVLPRGGSTHSCQLVQSMRGEHVTCRTRSSLALPSLRRERAAPSDSTMMLAY